MHIMDITQNSVRANASKVIITVNENIQGNVLQFSVEDNGCGMSEDMVKKVRDPFVTSRTTRKVGLGIPMLEQTALQCNGALTIESTPGKGTKIEATMDYDNIDRPPMGDMINTVHLLIIMNPTVDFKYIHYVNERNFELDTEEIRAELGEDVPINTQEVIVWLKEAISEGINELYE